MVATGLFGLAGCTSTGDVAPDVAVVATEPVATSRTFDMRTADPDAVAAALREDGRVTLRGITFAFDSAELDPESTRAVGTIGRVMNDYGGLKLAVVGHTDAVGAFRYNTALSQRRAEAIVARLGADYEVNPTRLVAHGVGPVAPVASNDTEAGRAQNRRVELILIE
ncbi:MAG: OmpA family protein [Pseudomonadota bacterium]